ncbi:MAG TPA: DUF3617 domain-containing protein [Bryobacteraceae bacterium]|nr:DUF3617 domain-containing protein [Bryobacteraceae bacterium]
MKINVSLGFAFLFCGAVWAGDTVQPLDVKLGLWESTTTMEHSGAPPIPDEVLARLTPEQRAKIEERAKASAQQGPKTTTRKNCIKKEDLDKAMAFGNNDKSCHRTVLASSSSKMEFRIECGAGTMKSNGDVHIEAINSEHVKGSVQMTMGDGTRSMKLNSTFESKWLGPVCEGTK